MGVQFQDFRMKVEGALDDACIAFLYKAGGELESQVKQNSRVDSGQLKNSWSYTVDESNGEVHVGSPLENAIWEEFGTGEYALNDNGRKGGWHYKDEEGKWHHTFGKTPRRALHNAFVTKKTVLIRLAEQMLKGRLK